MQIKRAAVFVLGVSWEMLYKDTGMIMVYLHSLFGIECMFVNYSDFSQAPDEFRGVKNIKIPNESRGLTRLVSYFRNRNIRKYIRENSKSIDMLILYHITVPNYWIAREYKKNNPAGKVLLKLDMSEMAYRKHELCGKRVLFSGKNKSLREHLDQLRNSVFHVSKYRALIKTVDYISVETSRVMDLLGTHGLYANQISDKLFLLPNGADDAGITEMGFQIMPYGKKENIILNIGRIGDPNKNCEMLLQAAGQTDMKDWKIIFIGEIDPCFREFYDYWIEANPDYNGKIILTGAVRDKKILYDYYNRAKVFTMTSYRESYGIVLVEALYFGNYIISTDTGASREVTADGTIGCIIPPGDTGALASELKKVFAGQVRLEEKYERSIELSREKFIWEKIIRNGMEQIAEIESRRGGSLS